MANAQEHATHWEAEYSPTKAWEELRCDNFLMPGDPALQLEPPPEVGALRAAAMKFSSQTAMSVDGFHCRHFGMLSDDASVAWEG